MLSKKIYFQDYPSVGQIAQKLEEQNIQPIFAVTKKMESVYKVRKTCLLNCFIIILYAFYNNTKISFCLCNRNTMFPVNKFENVGVSHSTQRHVLHTHS